MRPTNRLRTASITIAMALMLAACDAFNRAGTAGVDVAGRVDIGKGREMYLERRGTGSPTVVLVSGLDAAADLWSRHDQPAPKVFPEVAEFTQVCAYDRPGTPYGDGRPSRSDPVSQPTDTHDAVIDLHALLRAAGVPGPYVLVGHSYGGLVVRLYASTYPDEVCGMVLVDALSDGLQDAMTLEQWKTWKTINARQAKDIAEYPELEQIDFDVSLEQVRVAAPIRPMPLVVLSADVLYGPTFSSLIAAGVLPPDAPPDFGYVIDRANKVAQANLAQLVPGAKHITGTHSGHNMMTDQPQLVTNAIHEVVDAVRNGHAMLAELGGRGDVRSWGAPLHGLAPIARAGNRGVRAWGRGGVGEVLLDLRASRRQAASPDSVSCVQGLRTTPKHVITMPETGDHDGTVTAQQAHETRAEI